MSAQGEIIDLLRAMRGALMGTLRPDMGLMSALELLGRIQEQGREPSAEELVQAAAMLTVAAEAKLVRTSLQSPKGPSPAASSDEPSSS